MSIKTDIDNRINKIKNILSLINNELALKKVSPINNLSQLPNAIKSIKNGIDTSDATALNSDLIVGKTAYSKNGKIVGEIPRKSSQIYTPSNTDIIINKNVYLDDNQIIKGDINLKPENIKSNVTLFGVKGSLIIPKEKDIEIVEGGVSPPHFKKTNGSVRIWGWGEGSKDGKKAPKYYFEGNYYRVGVNSSEKIPFKLSFSNSGVLQGYPELTKGYFVAIREGGES